MKRAMRRRPLQKRGQEGRPVSVSSLGLQVTGVGAASTASVNGLQSRPLSLFFLFFLLLVKITESAKTRFNKYKNNSKLLIS